MVSYLLLTFLLYVFKEKMTDLQKTNKKKKTKSTACGAVHGADATFSIWIFLLTLCINV